MKFGAVLPTCEIGSDPLALRDWAQAAESLGYSHIVTYDHVLGAEHAGREPAFWGPYTERDDFHEPFVLFGYLAGVTSTIEFETGIIILPQRQAALVAKQAAEVDLLSGGRFRLGVGSGWNYIEYESLGADWERRGALLDDQIAVIRALWENDVIDYTSEFHRIDRAGIQPRPARRIPIWFGGYTPAALRRAARLGDGFTFGDSGPDTVALADRLRELLAEQGRDPAGFALEGEANFGIGPERWTALVDESRAAGFSHFSINCQSTTCEWGGNPAANLQNTAEHIAALETFISSVR